MKFNIYFDYENKTKEKETYFNILKEFENKEIGYYHLPENSMKFLNTDFNNIDYEEVVVIGIGGSSLGTKMVYSLTLNNKKKMIFLENPDPNDLSLKDF